MIAVAPLFLWLLSLMMSQVTAFAPWRPADVSQVKVLCAVKNNDEGTTKRRGLFAKLRRRRSEKKEPVQYRVTTEGELETYWKDDARRFRRKDNTIDHSAMLAALDVRGDTQVIGSPDHADFTHPVHRILHERRKGNHTDDTKIALAVEGGGMRGCISGGMICAIHYLNLTSSFDVVYGSSAGTVVAAYLLTEQLSWCGPEVYYDRLTTAGREFIDSRRLMRALGLGLLDPRLWRDVLTRPSGKPVLNLPFLLKTTVQETKPLDWDKLVARKIPLKVVASDLKNERSIALNLEDGHYTNLDDLTNCMHASCLLPGIAGPIMNMNTHTKSDENSPKFSVRNGVEDDHHIPLIDALVYEPLPFRSAVEEGATHVVAIRSRPDGIDVTGKSSMFEKLIFKRFFIRKNNLPNIYRRMRQQLHKKLYATDILRLNKEAISKRDHNDLSEPHLLPIALPPGSPEVTRLEVGREAIFEGMRRGFARAYDCLVEDPAERGRGSIVAKEFFPDEILEYDPLDIDVRHESAFAHIQQRSKKLV